MLYNLQWEHLSTDKIIKDCNSKIWVNYLTNSDFINDDNEGFLILDKATSHITKEIIKDFIFGNREISFISGGLTRFFQSLDVVVNKPFKSSIKEK